MSKKYLIPSIVATLWSIQPFVAANATTASNVSEMLAEGDTSVSFRYRYEMVDQEAVTETANASTLKSRLTYKSASYMGLSALLEVDNVLIIGDENYRTPSNGNIDYPIVADPKGTDFNQAVLTYKTDNLVTKLGKQRILHAGQRFVGGVGFRQNEQTYDAISLSTDKLGSISVDYSYIWSINRIFGPKDSVAQAKRWDSDSHILLASMSPAEGHSLKAYAYLLDFANAAANSSSTFGVEYSGQFSDISVSAAYATQSDYADNPNAYDANYVMAQISVPIKPVNVTLGYEVLGSDNGAAAFKTPLATLHKFQGWADKFLGTPANGVEDTYFKVAGKIGKTKTALVYHDFSADFGGADLGSEVDIVATYPLAKGLSAQLKYASYKAKSHASDTDKLWFTLSAKF
ncbi:MAG: hypothetical protein P8J25_01855 [Porticoccaceae bacterium]|nr:hypothetical protein [Porticoccaceae bacterium]